MTAAWPRADAGRRRCRAADSNSNRSSRGSGGPPAGRRADHRWRRGRSRCGSAARKWASRKTSTKQPLDRRAVVIELVVPVLADLVGMLQPVQRRLPGRRSRAAGLVEHGRERRIVAQLIVIDQILVAEREAEDALAQQRRQVWVISSASRRSRKQPADRSTGSSGRRHRAAAHHRST